MKKSFFLVFLLAACPAFAAEEWSPSLSDWGNVGLLQMPTARMPPDGSVGGGFTSLGGVHRHLTFDAQILPGLEVTARETVYPGYFGLSEPGLDLKLRLRREDEDGPSIAVGGRDVTGSGLDLPGKGRFAGEYLVATRRWWDLDLSLGLGWGTYGESGHFRNPLRFLGGRFRQDRDPSAWPSIRGPRAWFGGERVALFGGVEWFTPIPDLSLKLEYSGDRFRAQTQDDWLFRTGSHYNLGLSYRPAPWIDIGAGFEQGSRAMLRLSARFDPRSADEAPTSPPPSVGPRPTPGSALSPEALVTVARTHDLPARTALIAGDRAVLWLDPAGGGPAPLSREVGRAARLLADLMPAEVEYLTIVTGVAGLTGTSVTLHRREVERAANRRGSVDEIWRTAEVAPEAGPPPDWPPSLDLSVRPTAEVGLADLGYPLIARAYTDTLLRMEPWRGIVLAAGMRTNLGNNLAFLDTNALPAAEPVRSDLPLYAQALLQIEHLYGAWLAQPAPGLTTRLSAGHFEEMFGGIGVEVLYRPPQARWAVGLDLNEVWKRPPGAPFRIAAGSARLTGHASVYLEEPGARTASVLRLGRYLGGDWGATAEVLRRFDGGATLSAQATWTEGPDKGQSRFGGRLDYGISLAVPLAQSSWMPVGGLGRTAVGTLGRDAGQRLRQPLALYDLQVPAGFGSLAGTWSRLLD